MQDIPTEEFEQQKLVQWLQLNKYYFFAPLNENQGSFLNKKVTMLQEKKAKTIGKRKGVSDIIVFLKHKILFIELKRQAKPLKNGKLSYKHTKTSEEQKSFLNTVNGYNYAIGKVCYGFYEAVKFIEENNNVRA